jgi:hypothetical protein
MSVPVPCEGMRNPRRADHLDTPKSRRVGDRTLELRSGRLDGVEYAWARLINPDEGDIIWLEISDDGGDTWTQCGMRTIHASGRNFTDAQITNTSHEVCMRAGLQLAPQYQTDKWC